MPKVFLSYAKENNAVAKRVCEVLENYPNVSVWMDKQELVGGIEWEDEIERRVLNSDYFIPLLSKEYVIRSRYAQHELRLAVVESKNRDGSRFILPVRIEQCEIDVDGIDRLHCIDLFEVNLRSVHKLISAVGQYGEYTGDAELRLTAHQAVFRSDPNQFFYFVNMCNISNSNIIITHVHYQDPSTYIYVNPLSRKLPIRLEPSDIWCTFIKKASLPGLFQEEAYDKFFVRLGNGHIYRSVKEDTILNEGPVPGGEILIDDIIASAGSS